MANKRKHRAAASDDPLRRVRAEDAWWRAYSHDFWNGRREIILASGDEIRMKLLAEHDAREAQRGK